MSEIIAVKSEQTDQLFTALAKAQAEISTAAKDATNPHFKSKYADLASCWDACRGPLTRHGLCVVQIPSAVGAVVTVATVLGHTSGQYITGELTITAKDASPQSVGSAVTYARRYSLAAFVSVAPDDDDGNAAQPHKTEHRHHEPEHKPEPPAGYQTLRGLLKSMGCASPEHAQAVIAYGYDGATLAKCQGDGALSLKVVEGLGQRAATGGITDQQVYQDALKAAGIETKDGAQ